MHTFNLSDNWINEERKEPLKYILKEDKETFKKSSIKAMCLERRDNKH